MTRLTPSFKTLVPALLLLTLAACQVPKSTPGTASNPGTASPLPLSTPTSSPSPAGQSFLAELDGSQETPQVTTAGFGVASASLNPDKTEFSLNGVVSGLSGAVTAAHIHKGAKGAKGDPVKTLTVTGNRFALTWKSSDSDQPLSKELLDELTKGNLYLNLHTQAQPDGEIRGQLLASTGKDFAVLLEGDQEVPTTKSGASGSARVSLNAAQTEATISAAFVNLSGPATGAHLHKAAKGANGPVVKDLQIQGNRLSGTWRRTDATQPLTAALLQDLLQGNLYLNVHSKAYPAGEIRGQVSH
jgi:hypothetical protein